jgi:hypothetical protein
MPRRFQYLTDPLFLAALGGFSVNQLVLKPHLSKPFLHHHFNDLLLIPCALPILLWLHHRLGLRPSDGPPSGTEVALHLAVWCLLFEVAGPHLMNHATGDLWDVLAYCLGGAIAWAGWNFNRFNVPRVA